MNWNLLASYGWIILIPLLLVAVGWIIAVGFLNAYGHWKWRKKTECIVTRLRQTRQTPLKGIFNADELNGLPTPVQRYFKTVLSDGQPIITGVTLRQIGVFNVSETGEKWQPFHSEQHVTTTPPGFVWNASIRMFPGIPARVHDAYVAGKGYLQASLFGAITLADLKETPEIAYGELMRYLAEAAWYPTALLPSQGVLWEPVDENSAKATIKDGETELSMVFHFDQNGLIESAFSAKRGRKVGGKVITTPWEGRWTDYEKHDGMLIPTKGTVAWILPEGEQVYWKGKITTISYEYATAFKPDK